MSTEDATDNARAQALAQLQNIEAMLARLDHTGDCDGGDDCDADDATILGWLGYYHDGTKATEAQREQAHDYDEAIEAIEADALSVEVRSGWHAPGEESEDAEYLILLCTGGPAVRIIGELDEHGYPTSARLQYQDWGTPWTEYITTGPDHDALMDYASHYLGGYLGGYR